MACGTRPYLLCTSQRASRKKPSSVSPVSMNRATRMREVASGRLAMLWKPVKPLLPPKPVSLRKKSSMAATVSVNKLLPQGQGLAPVLIRRAATVSLGWDVRSKSRFGTTDTEGRALAVFLPRGSVVRGGDVLVAEDGSLIRELAAPQSVLRITPCPAHGSPFDLVRAAYHLGNRHVPIELTPEYLHIEPDHVLAEMLRAMHLTVTETQAPFEPEGGAYGGHGHAHEHGHTHTRAHEHPHAHSHEHQWPPRRPATPACCSSSGWLRPPCRWAGFRIRKGWNRWCTTRAAPVKTSPRNG